MHSQKINFYPAHGLDSYTGYGRMELGIAKGLQATDMEILLYPDRTRPMLMVNSSLQLLSAPHVNGTRLWAFNMIETNKVDPAWVEKINAQCERLLVPCPPMIEIYQQSGVIVPIDYVPLGMDLFDTQTIPPGAGQHDEVFQFLTYSYGGARKGADLSAQAFQAAFEGNRQYRLVIKAREGYNEPWLAQLDNHPQIEVVRGHQSETEWRELQAASHCFLFPSRGEGWGFPPRELTITGVPAIATQWLGMWDADQWGIPLKISGLAPCEFEDYQANAKDALWAEPDLEHLIAQMRWVVAHYDQAQLIARRGRAYLLQNFSWRSVAEQIKALVAQHG